MDGSLLNIGGSEWMIIIFVVLVLVLGTGKLPGAAKNIGRAVSEYNRAKKDIRAQMGDVGGITGQASSERAKLEHLARSLSIASEGRSDDDLRAAVTARLNAGSAHGTDVQDIPAGKSGAGKPQDAG